MDKKTEKEIYKIVDKSEFGTLKNYKPNIDTRHSWSYLLDIIMWWGIAIWHLMQLQWLSWYGKTTVATILMKAVQQSWWTVALIDFEHTYSNEYAEKMWLDWDNCFYATPSDWNKWFDLVKKLINTGYFDLIVIDSIPAARPRREHISDSGDANIGAHAKMVTAATYDWIIPMKRNNCSIVCINQWRDWIWPYKWSYAPWWVSIKHNSVQILRFLKPEPILDDDWIQVGFIANMKLTKSKLRKNVTKMKLKIFFDGWVDKKKDLINAGVLLNIIEKKGSRYKYKDMNVQGTNWLEDMDDETLDQLEEDVKKAIL